MSKCNLCPRQCNINRTDGEYGICNMPQMPVVARASLHYGEEPCVSGTNGSGTVFFSGCSLKCVFCQNYEISHNGFGKPISVEELSKIFKNLEISGAHNINLVTPTHFVPAIKDALRLYKPKIPIVYNCSGYEDIKVIEEDVFDVYLFDLKFFSSEKSLRYAKCPDYFKVASKALKRACEIKGEPIINSKGLIERGVIVRHLILPQSTNDSINIVNWLNENTPNIIFSLMSQYTPIYLAKDYPEINRRITKREYEKVVDVCYNNNFYDVYLQELSSATKEMIPDFNLSGVPNNIYNP